MERDLSYYHLLCVIGIFQLTRSRGAWHKLDSPKSLYTHFNSHAHVERDTPSIVVEEALKISTHTLTWSVTTGLDTLDDELLHFNSHAHVERDFFILLACKPFCISTHTLTWSVTDLPPRKIRLRLFQLTRSRGAWLFRSFSSVNSIWHFNSHAHVERDEWFWFPCHYKMISTHTLTWSVTS